MSKFNRLVKNFRTDLENELSYPHWTTEQRYVLQRALKWFDAQVFEITREYEDADMMDLLSY